MPQKIYAPLEKLLSHLASEKWEFVAKLNLDEQNKLYELIQKLLEEEGGVLFSTLGVISKILPNFLNAKIAQEMMGPKMVARMTTYIPSKKAIEVAKVMKIEFLAEVAIHLNPGKVVEIIEGSPDTLLINISGVLLKKGNYDVLGSYSDHLSHTKLKALAEKLKDPHGLVQIANMMKNKDRIIETALEFSDNYLLELMNGISHFNFYELAAMVGEALDLDRQISLLRKLEPSEGAKLAAHYNPEIIAKILNKIDAETAVNVAIEMTSDVLGNCFNYLDVDAINTFLPYLTIEKIIESAPHFNLKKLENIWPDLNNKALEILKKITG